MKHGPVTKLDKKNKTTSKKFDDNFMLAICDVIVIFAVYGQFRAIRKPDSGRIFYIFSLIGTFYLTKTENRN